MASATKYQMFTLLGNEFTFDVDVSKLGCGLNGALYFVSTATGLPRGRGADGRSRFPWTRTAV